MRKNVVILENKPEDFEVFLKCLQDQIKAKYTFHLVTDTRHYKVMKDIEKLARFYGIHFMQYDGAKELRDIMRIYSLGDWFKDYHKSCKLMLPLLFKTAGKFLYMDDDCLLLNDPEPLWEYDYCSGRETVFARITSASRWDAYRNVVRNPRITQEYYNKNQLNSGTFMYTCKDTLGYVSLMQGYSNAKYFKTEFNNGRFILDEEILSFWFIEKGNQFVPSSYITIRNGPFSFKPIFNKTPLVYHYAVKDEYTSAYRDYFGECICLPGMALSRYINSVGWNNRIPSSEPTFKKDMRGRTKNVR